MADLPPLLLVLETEAGTFPIVLDPECGLLEGLAAHPLLEGTADNIGGEVFFYQYVADLPFPGTEREVFEVGDVVYWRAREGTGRFGILVFYGNTAYGDGNAPRASSPGVRIGRIRADASALATIATGTSMALRHRE